MFAVTAARIDAENPLNGLELGERPDPVVPDGWTTVRVKAASLNHHDLWTLKGVGIRQEQLPMVLGGDAAGIDEDGNEVIVHSVIGDPDRGGGDETLDPKRSLLSEVYDGAFAEQVAVPRRNLVPKPAELSFEEAACLPTAWLTAYRMLFDKSGQQPGSTILVQGAGGGVSTALIALGSAAGYRVWATSRSAAKREAALKLGAAAAFEPAGTRRRGHGDRRRGHLVALGQVAASRRPDRGVRRHQRADAAGRAQPRLLPAAPGRRLDDGNSRPARTAGPFLCDDGRTAGHRPRAAPTRGQRRLRCPCRRRGLRQGRLHCLAGSVFGPVTVLADLGGCWLIGVGVG
jgi:Alcohol dehydrogenase GroES-like domain